MKGKRITFEQKQYLLRVYLEQGFTAASPIAIRYGISPKSVSKYAKAAGHKGKRGREPGIHGRNGRPDPRWNWAVERGAVVA